MGDNLQKITDKPPCYSDRGTWKPSDRYMFVSYAHKDSESVYSDLDVLYKNCLNYWYDKKLSVGDKWDETVESIVKDPQCAGIILYFSPDTVMSAACEEELLIYKELVKSGRKDFRLIPVSVNGTSVNATVRDAYIACAQLGPSELETKLPPTRVKTVLDTLNSNLLYLEKKENCQHIPRLIEQLKSYDENLFCSDDVALDKLSRLPISSEENGLSILRVGTYPQEKSEICCAIMNGVKENSRGRFTIKDRIGYLHNPVRWVIVRNDNSTAVALSECVLDKCSYKNLGTFCEEMKKVLFADSPEIADCIESIDIPSLEDLKEFAQKISPEEESEYSKSYPKNGLWQMYWGKNDEKIVAYYGKFNIIDSGHTSNMVCGIRPRMVINIDKLVERYSGGEQYKQ